MDTLYVKSNMDTSYAFTRPSTAKCQAPKRVRRVRPAVLESNTAFRYVCYACNMEMDLKIQEEVEIECGHCGGRVLQKVCTRKHRVVEAI